MHFRVTSNSFTQRAIHFSAFHSSNVLRHQEQITSGVRFQRPSEDPIAFRQATSLRSRFSELQADKNSIDRTTSILNASFTQIQDYSTVITRARSLAQQGVQSFDEDERNALALEVDGLFTQLKSIGLSQFNDRYLYGGARSESPPFEFVEIDAGGGRLNVVYQGSAERSRASVADSIAIDTYYSGAEVFGSTGRLPTVLFGTTGAATGQGTDTLKVRADLVVSHTLTNYQGASGIQPGTDSVSGDTVIGAIGTHTLTVVDLAGDGSSGTVSLNGNEPVAFTSSDTNLRVEGGAGEVVYVDTSSISAGFNGTIDLESTGTLSVDGGVTETVIDHTNNQVVEDSLSGGIVTIDSIGIRTVGTDHLEFPGTSDAFQVLYDLSSDLRNTRGLDSQDLAQSLDRRLADLERVASVAFDVLGEQSTSLSTLDNLGFRVDRLMLDVETQLSETQGTDLADAILRLENSQAMLQYTYAVTAELSSLSILNFLN